MSMHRTRYLVFIGYIFIQGLYQNNALITSYISYNTIKAILTSRKNKNSETYFDKVPEKKTNPLSSA